MIGDIRNKRIVYIDQAISDWAKECVQDYGPVVHLIDTNLEMGYRMTSVRQEDPEAHGFFSYWIQDDEIKFTDLNPEFRQQMEFGEQPTPLVESSKFDLKDNQVLQVGLDGKTDVVDKIETGRNPFYRMLFDFPAGKALTIQIHNNKIILAANKIDSLGSKIVLEEYR